MKVADLSGSALDWAVFEVEFGTIAFEFTRSFNPSTNWAQGGPIIERERIELARGNDLYFPGGNENGDFYEPLWIAGKMHGPTPLIAAMRCYVASKLGDDISIPKELTK